MLCSAGLALAIKSINMYYLSCLPKEWMNEYINLCSIY